MKNTKITIKLALMVIPALVCTIVLAIILKWKMESTYQETVDLYYDKLYTIGYNLSDLDRDFYQMLNEVNKIYINGDSYSADELAACVDSYESNLDEVYMKMGFVTDAMKEDPEFYSKISCNSSRIISNDLSLSIVDDTPDSVDSDDGAGI